MACSGFIRTRKRLRSSRTTTSGTESIWICAAFSASCGCGCACGVERVQNRPDLHMRPCSASRCAHIAFVELGGNGVVACYAAPHDLVDDGADVGCKPPCIGFQSRPAAFCNLGYVWIAQTLSPPLGGRQSVFGTL